MFACESREASAGIVMSPPCALNKNSVENAETGDFETAKKWSQQAVELSRKAVEGAEDEKEREQLKRELEQLEKELTTYEERKPVRERQTMEDKPAKSATEDEKKEGEDGEEDRLTPAEATGASGSTADF